MIATTRVLMLNEGLSLALTPRSGLVQSDRNRVYSASLTATHVNFACDHELYGANPSRLAPTCPSNALEVR